MSDEKYRAILERDPTDTQAFVALCNSAERNSDFQYLAQLYDFRAQVIADTKEIADLYFRAGEIYLDKLTETAKGVESLLKGFESDRTHAGIGDRLDAIYRDAGDWESAVQIAEQRLEALTGADKNGTKTVIRSDLHQQAGEIWEKVYSDRKRALAHYKRAIELDKTNLLALYGARDIYYQAGKFKNAAKLCEMEARAEKDAERRAALYRELAQIYEKNLEDMEQSIIALKRAFKSSPQNPEVQGELARVIAITPFTRESAKDHMWAAEYLLRQAYDADGLDAVDLASRAVTANPTGTKAMDFLETHAQESGNFTQLAATYEELLNTIPEVGMRNVLIGRLAALYQFRIGDERRAAQWRAKIQEADDSFQVLGSEEPYESLLTGESDGEEEMRISIPAAHSSAPPSPVAHHTSMPPIPKPTPGPMPAVSIPAPALSRPPAAPSIPAPAVSRPPAVHSVPPIMKASMPPTAAPVVAPAVAAPISHSFAQQEAVHHSPSIELRTSHPETAAPSTMAVPGRGPGMSDEDFAEVLRQASDRARRIGDDGCAELCLAQVLDLFPYDQKAITFLERRFRSRSDWAALRDLLLRSAGSPHLPLAVQTVRLREAARLSEEQLGDVNGAIVAWNQIKENDPKVRDAVDALIRLLDQAGQWSELQVLLLQEVETTKSRTKKMEAYRKLAEIYHRHVGDMEAAATAYQNVLELMPEDMSAIEALEEIYQRTDQFDQVVALLRKRADLSQNRAEKRDLLFRGAQVLREDLGRNEDAYAQAKEVLTLSKDDPEVLAFLTALDEEGGHWGRMMNILDLRIHSSASTEDKIQLLRKKAACALERMSDTQVAVQTLTSLLTLAKDDIEAMDSLIEIYRQTSDWEALVRMLKTRIAASADRSEQAALHRESARVLETKLGKENEAMASWRAVLEIEADAESLGALARYYERNQQWDSFAQVIEQQAAYAEDHIQRAEILFSRAVIFETKIKDRKHAVAELERILKEVDPTHDKTLNMLTEILVEEKRFAEAADLLDQRISYSQDKNATKGMLLTLGNWCTLELKDLERAMDAYEKAVQLDKDDAAVLDALDAVYSGLKEWDKLLKLLYARAKSAPNTDARFELLTRGASICEESLGDKKKAWTWYVEILDKLGHMKDAVDKVEQAARRMGLWKELLDLAGVMTKKAEDISEQVAWWLKAAEILEQKMGDANQALEAVLRAFGLEPDNRVLLDRVETLAVNVGNWQRLSTVYGVLVNRAESKPQKIELLTRYAKVLRDKADRPSDAFEISVRAFEMAPDSEELLQMVEEMGTSAGRFDDMVRIYNGCAKLAADPDQKVTLRLRAASMLKEKKGDPDGALSMILEAVRIDPFDSDITSKLWKEIDALEADLMPTEVGTYWHRAVELYRVLADEYKKDVDKRFQMLVRCSEVYLEKLKDTGSAFEVLKENQTLNPKDKRNLDKLEELAEKNNYWQALANHYQDVLDETFDMEVAVMLHRRRGKILLEHLSLPEEAAEHFWQIIQLDSSELGAYDSLIDHYEKSKQWNDLVNILERKLDNSKSDEDKLPILLRIGSVWENRIGNRYEAKDWYEQATSISPDNEEALAGLARLNKNQASPVSDSPNSDTEEDDDDMRELISIQPPPPKAQEEVETEVLPAEVVTAMLESAGRSEPAGAEPELEETASSTEDESDEASFAALSEPPALASKINSLSDEIGEDDSDEDASDDDGLGEDESQSDDVDSNRKSAHSVPPPPPPPPAAVKRVSLSPIHDAADREPPPPMAVGSALKAPLPPSALPKKPGPLEKSSSLDLNLDGDLLFEEDDNL